MSKKKKRRYPKKRMQDVGLLERAIDKVMTPGLDYLDRMAFPKKTKHRRGTKTTGSKK